MVAISFVAGFTLTYLFGFEDEDSDTRPNKVETEEISANTKKDEDIIFSPLDGQLLALDQVNDPVFASGAMGKGVAIKPSGNSLYAPLGGRVEVVFETGHAFAITSARGAEVLIHIGIDTVSMAGLGFEPLVSVGQEVKKGDLLARFDSAKIKAAGLEDVTMVVLTNTSDYEEITIVGATELSHGQELFMAR
ncbi:PTS system sucrose-specific transporter subunit IIABC [Streptococcus pseudoporcinus]|uniref:PTS system sucrose-specific transporter subunit IIABC n=2 Tax=Streptococcus pseudoporcinus TaxID=361101 RepID=A0A4U9Y6N9_9STRE|nr:PTS system sucrose-specific transporter subunit IIABC [Streptococcus pseudoporcinus]